MGFPCGSAGKESTCNAGSWVQSLCWEDPLEKGSHLENSMDCIAHGVANSPSRLSNFHFHFHMYNDLLCWTAETNTILQSNYTPIKINFKSKRCMLSIKKNKT